MMRCTLINEMFVNSYKSLFRTEKELIVDLFVSKPDGILLLLTQKCLLIYDISFIETELILKYENKESIVNEYGYYHWMVFVDPDEMVISIGTKSGLIQFLRLDRDDKFNVINVVINKTITYCFSLYNYLFVCTDESKIYVLEDTGETIKELIFDDVKSVINFVSIYDDFLLITFECGRSVLYDAEDILHYDEEIINLYGKSTSIENSSRSYLFEDFFIYLTFDYNLFYLSRYEDIPELFLIDENVISFNIVEDMSHVIYLSMNGEIIVYSLFNQTKMSTSLSGISLFKFDIDQEGVRLYGIRRVEMYEIDIAKTDTLNPTTVFHTKNSVMDLSSDTVLEIPPGILERPISNACFSDEFSTYLILSKDNTILIKNKKEIYVVDVTFVSHHCWYQNGFFVIIDEFEDQCRVILADPQKCDILDIYNIKSRPKCYDMFNNTLIVGSSTSLHYLKIDPQESVLVHSDTKEIDNLYNVSLLSDCTTTVVVKSCGHVCSVLPFDLEICQGVTSVKSIGGMLLIVSHRNQFARFGSNMVVLKEKVFVLNYLSYYSLPKSYEIGRPFLIFTEFLHDIIFSFIDDSKKVATLISIIHSQEGIIQAIVNVIKRCLEKDRFHDFMQALRHLPNIKDHFLVVALFKLDKKYTKIIKNELPDLDTLKGKFPMVDFSVIY